MSISSFEDQVCGDVWKWIWDVDQDLSTWDLSTISATLRDGPLHTSHSLASNNAANLITTGSVPLDIPASVFASSGSIFSMYISATTTSGFDPATSAFDPTTTGLRSRTVYISARCEIDGSVTTFLPATPFLAFSSIAHT